MQTHRKAVPRAMVVGVITTIVTYVFGVIFSDIVGLPYYIVGILSIPVTFSIAYFMNRSWVFNEELEHEVQWEDLELNKERVVTCHHR